MSAAVAAVSERDLRGALLLGLIQGLTEFLPVSSSGHLVLGGHLLGGLAAESLLFDVLVHLGTLLPVLVLYRREIVEVLTVPARLGKASLRELWQRDRGLRLVVCVVIGTIPTGLIGVALEDWFERLFSSLRTVGVTFLITGGILLLTRLGPRPAPGEAQQEPADSHLGLTPLRALVVGVAQGLAITPGISRSGTTIATALLLGVERAMAARLSFLLSVPAILGAVALQLRKLGDAGQAPLGVFAAGAVAAAVSGYLALRWLVRLVRRGNLHWFSAYLWPLGLAVLAYTLLS
jgi:undecaprenyl-diphosphatase